MLVNFQDVFRIGMGSAPQPITNDICKHVLQEVWRATINNSSMLILPSEHFCADIELCKKS